MQQLARGRLALSSSVLLACLGCSPDTVKPPLSQTVQREGSLHSLRQTTAVDRIPLVSDGSAFSATLRAHHPGISGTVLVEVDVQADGRVSEVRLAEPGRAKSVQAVLASVDATGKRKERALRSANNPRLFDAAKAVLLATSFTPATLDGAPVPFTMKMTIGF